MFYSDGPVGNMDTPPLNRGMHEPLEQNLWGHSQNLSLVLENKHVQWQNIGQSSIPELNDGRF